jgi:acetolactate synthase-1/2/3 large subunit
MIQASDLFVDCLVAHGVTTIFGVPGEENLDLVESLRKSTIKLVVTRNEQTAVFMAATRGRLTGKVGVALATLWPWATNMVTGIAHAQLAGVPILVITGQKPVKVSKQGWFQIIDVVGMMKPITKRTTSIIDIQRIPATIAQAWMLAETERPGAVHIELPEDIARETTDKFSCPISVQTIRRPIIDQKMLAQLVDTLQKAKRPIILIGAGANRKRITNYLTKFIQKTNIPFFTSQMGKGVVDESLPQYLGTGALTSWDGVHKIIDQADCVLAVWYDVIEKPATIVDRCDTTLIHINFYPAQVDQTYQPTLQVVGDIGSTFWQLYESDLDTSHRDFADMYAQAQVYHAEMQEKTTQEMQAPEVWLRALARILRQHLQTEDVLALDNGLYKLWLTRNFPAYHANTFLVDNALATMGAGVSMGMAVRLLDQEHEVVCVVGDGGLMMNLGDLHTAVTLGWPLTIILLNDNAYGMIKWKQHAMGFQDFGLDLTNPDFNLLAQSFGADYQFADSPQKLQEALKKTHMQPGVHLIEVPIVYPAEVN